MHQTSHTLPAPVAKVLSMLPAYPGSLLFAAGLNLAIKKHLPDDVRELLVGKKLRIGVLDAQLSFDFEWRNNGFVGCEKNDQPDLTIAASSHDFLLLAQRKEDPDTLFFSRRLVMEGDTELGLLLKNTIDAIDFPVFDPSQLLPANVFARLRAFVKP